MAVDRRALRKFPGRKRIGRRRRSVPVEVEPNGAPHGQVVDDVKLAMESYDLEFLEQTISRDNGRMTDRQRREAEKLLQMMKGYRQLTDLALTELEQLLGEWAAFSVVLSRANFGVFVSVFNLGQVSIVDDFDVHHGYTLRHLRADLNEKLRLSFTTIACFVDGSGLVLSLEQSLEAFVKSDVHPHLMARALVTEPSSLAIREFTNDFKEFDKEDSGFLTRDDVLKGFNGECLESELEQFFWSGDLDRDGRVSLPEYIVYANSLALIGHS
jgi:hypothetical protein